MAVFEHPEGLSGAARAAIGAVVAIDRGPAAINVQPAVPGEIAEPLRLAMGLHVGRLVFGRIGWGAAALPTVIGPAVNVASRLESLANAREVELALRMCDSAGLAVGVFTIEDVDIRGLEVAFSVVRLSSVADLAPSWAGWRDNQQP